MSLLYGLCALFLSFLSLATTVHAFSYTFGTPSQCDDLPLSWTGGTAPFSLTIVPSFGTPRNISIPDSAFSNGKGSYSFQFPMPSGSQFVMVMSDATGFNAGGVTQILTTQNSTSKAECATADPAVAFFFELNSALQQCRPFTFDGFKGAAQPITISAIIPGGAVTTLVPPVGSSNFAWTANAAHGTTMIFMMTDVQGRSGGSSDFRTVSASDDATCLNANSPVSTANPPAISSTATPTKSATPTTSKTPSASASPSASEPPSQGFTIAAIAGTVIGSLLFLAVVITLGLFFLRRKRENEQVLLAPGAPPPGGHGRRFGSGALELNNTASPYGSYPAYDQSGAYAPPHAGSTNAFAASNPFLDDPSQSNQPYHGSQYDGSTYGGRRYEPSEGGTYNPHDQQQYGGMHSSPSLYPPSNYASNPQTPADPFNASSAPMLPELNLHNSPPQLYPPPPLPPSGSNANAAASDPFRSHRTPSSSTGDILPYLQPSGSGSATAESTTLSTARRNSSKAAQAGVSAYKPARFILHTDVEDDLPPVDEDEVIELPPQYSERRGPPPPPPPHTTTATPSSPPLTTVHRPGYSQSGSQQNTSSSTTADPFARAP